MPKKSAAKGKSGIELFAAPAARTKGAKGSSGSGGSSLKKKKKEANPLFQPIRKKSYGIGRDVLPRKRDLTRFDKWPKYIRRQRQRRILWHRLKVPGIVNQFTKTLDKHTAAALFTFLQKYSPEDRKQRKQRMLDSAKSAAGDIGKRPKQVQYGLNHVTKMIERKEAKLVVIAHDVDPIELVMWIPTLCRKTGTPYVIVKGKSRLGQVVHKKTAAVLAISDIDEGKHGKDLSNFIERAKDNFLERYSETIKTPGGGEQGHKHIMKKIQEAKRVEAEQKKNKD